MRFIYLLFFLVIFSQSQSQHRISIDIRNYENDSLLIGYYVLDKQLVQDTLFANEQGQFILEDTLVPGVYIALTFPDKQFIQFMVNEEEKEFKMSYDYENKLDLSFENTKDNSNFQAYLRLLAELRPVADRLRDTIAKLQDSNLSFQLFQDSLDLINQNVVDKQKEVMNDNPGFISGLILRSNQEIIMPEFGRTEEERMAQYLYYKSHYFDFIELDNPLSLYTPFLYERVNYYIEKLTPNHPDSISQSIDSLLHWMSPAEETFRYYLSHFLNKYAKAKVVGYDAVYVHLVDNYYVKGKADWIDEENLLKIIERSNMIKPVLLGKTGADIKVFQEDGTPISISDIDYEYLVLLFWAPDCGHCKKTMPEFVEFNEKYKDKGIKTFAICTKQREKAENCWEAIEEKNMHGFINAADANMISRYKLKYNVTSTPKVFILDKNREILMKNIGASQLEKVFEEIFQMKEQERLEGGE